MQGRLELLPPVAPRQGHRPRALLASSALHLLIAAMILGVGDDPPPPNHPAPNPEKLVWTPPPVMPVVTPAIPKGKPIEYAAAPSSSAGKSPGTRQTASEGSTNEESKWRDFLSRAAALQAEGISAPAYVIDNLSPALIATLTERGLAILVAGRPPFRNDAQQVMWKGNTPTQVVALSQSWSRDVARRGIPLPRSWVAGLTLGPSVDVYLIPRAPLDLAILASQLEAAEGRGVPLAAVRRTHGRLVTEHDDVLAYRVGGLDLRDQS
jgi:hypothetical protein